MFTDLVPKASCNAEYQQCDDPARSSDLHVLEKDEENSKDVNLYNERIQFEKRILLFGSKNSTGKQKTHC